MSTSDLIGIIGATSAIIAALIPIVYEIIKNRKIRDTNQRHESEIPSSKKISRTVEESELLRLAEWQESDSSVPKYMARIFSELVSKKFEFHQLEGVKGYVYLGKNLTKEQIDKIPLCENFEDHLGNKWYYTKNLNKNDGEAENVMRHILTNKKTLDRSKMKEMKRGDQ